MKTRLLAVAVFSIVAGTSNAPAATDPSVWVRTNSALRSAALRTVQLRLCTEYRAPRDLPSCMTDGRKLEEILSFSKTLSVTEQTRLAQALKTSVAEVQKLAITAIHTDRLAHLLSSSDTIQYLRNISFYHNYTLDSFNLWSLSVSESRTKIEALERIAVLFQDLSESKEHLNWVRSQELPSVSVQELLETNAELAQDLKLGVTGATNIQHAAHYPAAVFRRDPESFSPGVYHFYSTAYWVTRLRKLGVSRENAILHAFGIHLAYELSSLRQNQGLWPIGLLPSQLTSAYKSRDLSTAYWGAVYGAALTDPKPVPAPKAGLAKRFQFRFREEVQKLLTIR